jgi:hypothetical protein
MAFLLRDFADLRNDIEEMLRKQSVIEKQAEVRVNIDLYLNELNTRDQYGRDKQGSTNWFNSSRREENLNRILFDLTKARFALLNTESSADPTSALTLASCALTELSIMNICNTNRTVFDRIKVLDTIKQYEAYFSSVKDPAVEGSAASYLSQRLASRESTLKWFRSDPKWVEMEKIGVVNNCAKRTDGGVLVSQVRATQQIRFSDNNALDDADVKAAFKKMNIRPTNGTSLVIRRLRFEPGPSADDVTFESGLLTAGNKFLTVPDAAQWKYGEIPDCTEARDAQIVPPYQLGGSPKVQTEAERKDAMLRSTVWKTIAKQTGALQEHVEQYNLDNAKIVYTTEVLSAVDETLKSLSALKRSYR